MTLRCLGLRRKVQFDPNLLIELAGCYYNELSTLKHCHQYTNSWTSIKSSPNLQELLNALYRSAATTPSDLNMPPPSTVKDIAPPEATASVAAQGFATGVLRFGSISLLSHIALNRIHPVYRGLTIQFKVYIQLSAMLLGGCIFAEKRVSEYNDMIRARRRAMERSARAWSEERELRERIDRENTEGQGSAK